MIIRMLVFRNLLMNAQNDNDRISFAWGLFLITLLFLPPITASIADVSDVSAQKNVQTIEQNLNQDLGQGSETDANNADESTKEFVFIDEVEYEVPANWLGRQVKSRSETPVDIALIPTEYNRNNTEIYIRREARNALVKLMQKAENDEIMLKVKSGYRSIKVQIEIYKKRLVRGDTFKHIAASVAPPGYSQHHLGDTVDFFTNHNVFGHSEAYAWLKNNAADYCFTESYPKYGKQLAWEAWHWRYTPCEEAANGNKRN